MLFELTNSQIYAISLEIIFAACASAVIYYRIGRKQDFEGENKQVRMVLSVLFSFVIIFFVWLVIAIVSSAIFEELRNYISISESGALLTATIVSLLANIPAVSLAVYFEKPAYPQVDN